MLEGVRSMLFYFCCLQAEKLERDIKRRKLTADQEDDAAPRANLKLQPKRSEVKFSFRLVCMNVCAASLCNTSRVVIFFVQTGVHEFVCAASLCNTSRVV